MSRMKHVSHSQNDDISDFPGACAEKRDTQLRNALRHQEEHVRLMFGHVPTAADSL